MADTYSNVYLNENIVILPYACYNHTAQRSSL